MQYKVNRAEAAKFAHVWNKGGLTMILPDTAIDFATDFANVVLHNFIEMCKAQAQAKQQPSPPLVTES